MAMVMTMLMHMVTKEMVILTKMEAIDGVVIMEMAIVEKVK
jgi:hypothetical protein